MLNGATVVVVKLIAAHRAWSATPLKAVKAWLALVILTFARPEIASSISVPRLLLVVVPHTPDCSPLPTSSIRKSVEYELDIIVP